MGSVCERERVGGWGGGGGKLIGDGGGVCVEGQLSG